MSVQIVCTQCGETFSVKPNRATSAKFCSRTCKDEGQKDICGEKHPLWSGGQRVKICKFCGADFTLRENESLTNFKSRIFCSKDCSNKGQKRSSRAKTLTCAFCSKDFNIIPAREKTAKYCSRKCKDADRTNIKGEKHPRWSGGSRLKTCKQCGVKFGPRSTEANSIFRFRKFCTKSCADIGGLRYFGADHPRWNGGGTKRSSKHYTWSNKVIARDGGVCNHCGISGTELHAHHIKTFIDHPEQRYDVKNGITLCAPCHWEVHSSSGEVTTPASGVQQGVTSGKKTYRRVVKPCANCGKDVSRTLANYNKSKSGRVFCDKSCVGEYRKKTEMASW